MARLRDSQQQWQHGRKKKKKKKENYRLYKVVLNLESASPFFSGPYKELRVDPAGQSSAAPSGWSTSRSMFRGSLATWFFSLYTRG